MQFQQGEELREFNSLYKELDELYHAAALRMGLSDSAFTVLYTICAEGDGCSQKAICEQAFVSKQTINSAIAKLQREQYIRLQKGEKGRELHIYLTPAGRQLVQEKIHPVIAMENAVFAKMPLPESRELLRLTRKYVVAFREETRRWLSLEVPQ